MDIDGMGYALVDQLVSKGMVQNVADIYRLTVEQLMDLERMGKKSADKIIANIDTSRARPLPRVLNGLGIPFVGERTAQILGDTFGSLDVIAEFESGKLARGRRGRTQGRAQHLQVFQRSRAIRNWSSGCENPGCNSSSRSSLKKRLEPWPGNRSFSRGHYQH